MPISTIPTVLSDTLKPSKKDNDMTERQAIELKELAKAAGEPFDTSLTEAQAEERIAILRDKIKSDDPGLTR